MCASPDVRLLVMFGKPPLDPARRHVPAAPALPTPTRAFPEAHLIPLPGTDPEDVVVGTDGMLYCGLAGGAIVRVHPDTHRSAIVATTGGRPLGLEPHGDGLLVCDAHRGLLRVDPATGHVATLVAHVDGSPLRFCSNAAVAPDDSIWFTESSTRFGFAHFMGAFMEHRPSGRLLRRDADGTVAVVLENLDFPNGLALTPAGDALILVETAGYRISRIDLAAPQNPPHVLADNLPGFPDNLSVFRDGRAWVAFTNPRSRDLDRSGQLPAMARKLIWQLPERWIPAPDDIVWLRAIDTDGRVVEDLHAVRPDYEMATGVVEHGGRLYAAGLRRSSLLCLDLRDTAT